jgi:predicted Fe-Mo cluster-binding NifX family protein
MDTPHCDLLVIAVPSANPGGLDAAVGAHFGHCDLYTLIDTQGTEILNVRTLENVPHQQGGCMAPVTHLARNGVQVLIAGGMGMRPLMGFEQVGVRVFYGSGAPSVGHAVRAFLAGELPAFTLNETCGGSH